MMTEPDHWFVAIIKHIERQFIASSLTASISLWFRALVHSQLPEMTRQEWIRAHGRARHLSAQLSATVARNWSVSAGSPGRPGFPAIIYMSGYEPQICKY